MLVSFVPQMDSIFISKQNTKEKLFANPRSGKKGYINLAPSRAPSSEVLICSDKGPVLFLKPIYSIICCAFPWNVFVLTF